MGTLSVRGDVLVVPPFECAWLKLDKPGEGCFTFLAKAENDVTLIFSSNAEGKRVCGTRRNSEFYTVIIGSHVNSRLVLERSGKIVHEVAGVRASPTKFTQYWVDYQTGRVSVGVGAKPGFNCLSQWQDPEPYMSIACLGLSAWDKHVCYSGLRLMGRLCFAPQSRRGSEEWQQPRAGQVASLQMLSAWRLSECLTPANCLSVLAVAEDLRATPLVRTTLDYLSSHLVEVVGASGHELFSLSTRSLADVLSRDKLSLVSEYWAFSSVLLTWQGQGGGAAEDLWEFIRWPLMSSSELERVEALPCYAGSARLRRLVAEARRTHSTKGDPKKTRRYQNVLITAARGIELRGQESAKLARSRLQPRRSPSARELLYVSDGDNNGVCFYLGTRRGEASSSRARSQFVNPSLTGVVEASTSSPHSRFSSAAAVTSRLCPRTSYFDPRYNEETKRKEAWWQVDLRRSLTCNQYSLRHDASNEGFLRSWELRGSEDGESWTTLRSHSDDSTIVKAYQYASWPVYTKQSFRIFRIVLTGPNAATTSRLSLSWFELYGHLEDGSH